MKFGLFVVNAEMDKLSKDLDRLVSESKKLSGFVGNITFDYEEQELIRRILKSVFTQFKDARDKETARSILNRTEWIDGK